jgi:hypothetical protein
MTLECFPLLSLVLLTQTKGHCDVALSSSSRLVDQARLRRVSGCASSAGWQCASGDRPASSSCLSAAPCGCTTESPISAPPLPLQSTAPCLAHDTHTHTHVITPARARSTLHGQIAIYVHWAHCRPWDRSSSFSSSGMLCRSMLPASNNLRAHPGTTTAIIASAY